MVHFQNFCPISKKKLKGQEHEETLAVICDQQHHIFQNPQTYYALRTNSNRKE